MMWIKLANVNLCQYTKKLGMSSTLPHIAYGVTYVRVLRIYMESAPGCYINYRLNQSVVCYINLSVTSDSVR